jgi:hypothetical protein
MLSILRGITIFKISSFRPRQTLDLRRVFDTTPQTRGKSFTLKQDVDRVRRLSGRSSTTLCFFTFAGCCSGRIYYRRIASNIIIYLSVYPDGRRVHIRVQPRSRCPCVSRRNSIKSPPPSDVAYTVYTVIIL